MPSHNRVAVAQIVIGLGLLTFTFGAAVAAPAAEKQSQPILRLEPGGPTSFLSSLAFGPDGQTLYAAGWDKVAYAWTRDAASGKFLLDSPATYRVPIGPGLHGVLNALAVSPDGSLLAVAGQGVIKVASDMRNPGWVVPAKIVDDDGLRQQGTIYVFDTRRRTAVPLLGTLGPVLAMTFAPAAEGKPPVLVSAGKERDAATQKDVNVVRVWNATSGAYLDGAQIPFVPGGPLTRPALVAWHTGPAISQLRIAIAWGDGSRQLRIWDVQRRLLPAATDGDYNNVAAPGPAAGQLLTGCRGSLKRWRLPADGGTAPSVEQELKLPQAVPRAITLFASRAEGRLDRAAVVVRSLGPSGDDLIRVVDLDDFRLLEASVPLWKGRGVMPTIQAAVRSRCIAVTGGAEHELRVLAVDDLLAGRNRFQSLSAPGITPRFAEFVRQKDRYGLLISKQLPSGPESLARPPAQEDWIFDFDPQIGMTKANAEWAPAAPQTQGWKLTPRRLGEQSGQQTEVRYEVLVQSPDGHSVPVRLMPGCEPTAYAVLPPNRLLSIPLVAVAAHELGQPSLFIYNGETGEPIRMCQGHVERIRSLSFSDDGRFLLSASDDRTICVWGLKDLDTIIGKRGTLPGLVLERLHGKVVVTEALEASMPQLAIGDVLDGIVEASGLRAIASSPEFYLAFSRNKPGQSIVLARRRGAGPQEQVTVRVAQGMDERKPLFALFITRDKDDSPWQWIGWSPLGWYDASQDAAARLLGWHFNTSDPAEPARFAQAQEYKNLYHPGLLPELLRGKMPDEQPPPLPRPAVKLSMKEPDQPHRLVDNSEVAIYRDRKSELRLHLMGPATDRLAQVEWQLASGAATPCKEVGSHEWSIPLDSFSRVRDEQKLRIILRTNESAPQTFIEEAAVRYQPSPPAITAIAPEKMRSEVRGAEFNFQARLDSLDPQLASQLKVTLIQSAGTVEVFAESWMSSSAAVIQKPLKLKPGDNTIQLTVVNADAGTAAAESTAESTVVTRTINYSPPPVAVAPPKVTMYLTEAGAGKPALSEGPNETIDIDRPIIHLQGKVLGTEPLAEVYWQRDKTSPPTLATGFKSLAALSVDVSQDIQLEPGLQTVWCGAKTAHSVPTGVAWKVFYHPPLPQPVWTSPAEGTDLVAGRDGRKIAVRGSFPALPGDQGTKYPFEVSILRNGNPLQLKVDVNAESPTLAAEVELEPGINRLQWRVANRWDGAALSDVRSVRYLRLPVVRKFDAPSGVKDPFVDCIAYVESPPDLPLRAITLNDRPVPLDGMLLEKHGPEGDLWKIALPRIPLVEGPNTIVVSAKNDDGGALEPRKLTVKVTVPPPPKAEVAFLQPSEDLQIDNDQLKVRLNVKSASRIEALSLRLADKVWPLSVEKQVEHSPDGFEVSAEVDVPLTANANLLEAVAINRGGESRKSVYVTYVPRPVRLFVDRVETVQSHRQTAAALAEGGRPVFPQPADEGIIWLHGRIRWANDAERRKSLAPQAHLFVSVNGFLQPQVVLGSGPELEQAWQAKIRLNQPTNKVTVLLQGLRQDASNRSEFRIDCRQPDSRQRLLLLVVSIRDDDPEKLTRQALEAVQGRLVGNQKDLVTPVFSRGKIFATLTGERANRRALQSQLFNIRYAIKGNVSQDDLGNDVVLIYYRGPETVEKSGKFHLLTSDAGEGLSGTELAEIFRDAPGAQVFLLDVERLSAKAESGRRAAPQWPSTSRIAAMRCAWLNLNNTPHDAGLLLSELKTVVPSASNLYEISAEVSRKIRDAYPENMIYDPYIPGDLNSVVLRKP